MQRQEVKSSSLMYLDKLDLAFLVFRTGEHWMACSHTEFQHNVEFRCFSRRPQHCPYTSSHACAVDIHKSDKVFMSSKFRCLTTTRIRSWRYKVTKASQGQTGEPRADGSSHRYPGVTRMPVHPTQEPLLLHKWMMDIFAIWVYFCPNKTEAF